MVPTLVNQISLDFFHGFFLVNWQNTEVILGRPLAGNLGYVSGPVPLFGSDRDRCS